MSLHSVREITLFSFFFFSSVFFLNLPPLPPTPTPLSLWRELCCLLLMCFWQLNLISGLLVKEALDCSHRKNTLFFPSHVLQNAAAQSVDDPVLRDGRKQGRAVQNPQGEGRREGKRVAGERGRERDRVRKDPISKKGTCGKLTQMLFFLLSLSPSTSSTLPPPPA